MRKYSLVLALLLIFLGSFAVSAATIGCVESRKIFMEYKEAKTAQEDLDKKQKEFKKKLDEKQEEIDKAKKDGKTDEEVKALIKDIEKELGAEKDEMEKSLEQMNKKLESDIVKAVDAVSKELGIDVVLKKEALITGGVDITDMVIAKLNKQK